jgi:carboxyl-terminal processing protease
MQYSQRQMTEALEKARVKKNLVLDLRQNSGGSVESMRDMVGRFFPWGTPIGTFSRKDSPDNNVKVGNRKPYNGRVVLLVDGGSASASEISAAAFKEHGRAIIVGRPTAGAVLSSIFVPVGEGYMLQFPIQDYKTKGGVRLEGNGVKPDVEISTRAARRVLPGQTDEGIEMALKVLHGQVKVAVKGAAGETK